MGRASRWSNPDIDSRDILQDPIFVCTQIIQFMSYPPFVTFTIIDIRSPLEFSYYPDALSSSLQSPATLEHLKLKCKIVLLCWSRFRARLSQVDVLTPLDHLISLLALEYVELMWILFFLCPIILRIGLKKSESTSMHLSFRNFRGVLRRVSCL